MEDQSWNLLGAARSDLARSPEAQKRRGGLELEASPERQTRQIQEEERRMIEHGFSQQFQGEARRRLTGGLTLSH